MALDPTDFLTAFKYMLSTNKFRILQRNGTKASLSLPSLKQGEIAIASDTQEVFAITSNGVAKQLVGTETYISKQATLAALQSAYPTGEVGDKHIAGSPPHIYGWQSGAWTDWGVWNDYSQYQNIAGGASYPFTAMPYVGSDPIISYGSTAAGYWEKRESGVMYQYGRKSVTSAIDTASGSMFISSLITITFPIQFTALHSCLTSQFSGTNAALAFGRDTTTTTHTCYLMRPVTSTSETREVSWHASGRWKA